MHTHRSTRALGALTLGLALTLTACGSDDDGGSETAAVSTTEHNDADVAFASDMIQHHAQALAMVDLTIDRDLDPQVQRLAEAIRDAQGPEIETMGDWLTDWDEEVPETVRDHSNADGGMDDDMDEDMGSGMPGMMSDDELRDLEDTPDADFQARWLEMMVEHHEGAVEMAKAEQQDGRFKPAVDLAEDIAASQTKEIDTMEELLG
jgi:uncharacterized protein (DUF305 family)